MLNSISEIQIYIGAQFLVRKSRENPNELNYYEVITFSDPAMSRKSGGLIVRRWGTCAECADFSLPQGGKILIGRGPTCAPERLANHIVAGKCDKGYMPRVICGNDDDFHHHARNAPFGNSSVTFSPSAFFGHYTHRQREDIAQALYHLGRGHVTAMALKTYLGEGWVGYDEDAARDRELLLLLEAEAEAEAEAARIEADHGPNWGNWDSFAK